MTVSSGVFGVGIWHCFALEWFTVVICNQLGYNSAKNFTAHFHFGEVPEVFSMDSVHCSGSESTLQDCSYSTTENCHKAEEFGVICDSTSGCPPGWIDSTYYNTPNQHVTYSHITRVTPTGSMPTPSVRTREDTWPNQRTWTNTTFCYL